MKDKFWYAGYASNLSARRFRFYLEGGLLAESGRLHPGARDSTAPAASVQLWLPGTVYFAMESTMWGHSGRALYDPDTPGYSAARGYLITSGQLLDVVAQEMYLAPGSFDDASVPASAGERVRLGDGCYETLVCTQVLGGVPVVTMAAPWRLTDVPLRGLSASYRAMITAGLQEMGWTSGEAAEYLATLPGGAMSV
jgi:hypothetical protein